MMQSIATLVVALSCCYMMWCGLDVRNIRARMGKRADEFDSDVAAFVSDLEQKRQYFNDEAENIRLSSRAVRGLSWNRR